MIRLPDPPTQPLLIGFWTVLSVMIGLAVVAILWTAGAPAAPLWGLALAVVLASLVWWRPALARRPYRVWDQAAGLVGRVARRWFTGVCFLILGVVSRAGSRLAGSEPAPNASGWAPKRQSGPGSYGSTSDRAHVAGADPGGLRSLAAWARGSGELWVWALLPFLFLLGALEGEDRGSLGGNVYTLY